MVDHTTLYAACDLGHVDKIPKLLRNGRIDPGESRSLCLELAVYSLNYDIVDLLIKDGRVDVRMTNNEPIIDLYFFMIERLPKDYEKNIWRVKFIFKLLYKEYIENGYMFELIKSLKNDSEDYRTAINFMEKIYNEK